MRVGLEALRKGLPTYPWVCREVLGLNADPSCWEILQAVHQVFHDTSRLTDEKEKVYQRVAAVTAAVTLVRNLEAF